MIGAKLNSMDSSTISEKARLYQPVPALNVSR